MKKTFMIALAGMMLFAFTQCGDGDANKKEKEANKGSKEYINWKEAYDYAEKVLKDIKSCEEFDYADKKIENVLGKADKDAITDYYEENEQLTEKEREILLKREKELGELYFEKKEKLCN